MNAAGVCSIVSILFVTTTAGAQCHDIETYLNDWAGPVKWNQLDPLSTYGAASFIDPTDLSALVADDFLCTDPGPIADIRFAGWTNETVTNFRITFWSDVPETGEDESHPGDLLYDQIIGPADPNDPLKLGWQESGGYYRINLPKDKWFQQEGTANQPIVYWIGIQATGPQLWHWYWKFRDPTAGSWGDDAAYESDYYGYPPWYNWGWLDDWTDVEVYDGLLPSGWDGSADMGFALSVPEPGTMVVLFSSGLGGLIRRRK